MGKLLRSIIRHKRSPTLVFFKDGAEKARLTGAVKKAQLAETINSIDLGEMDMTITIAGNVKGIAEGTYSGTARYRRER